MFAIEGLDMEQVMSRKINDCIKKYLEPIQKAMEHKELGKSDTEKLNKEKAELKDKVEFYEDIMAERTERMDN